jgi:hypothetical protein
MHAAMTIWRSAARLLSQAIQAATLSKWIFAAVIIGAGLAYLTVASHLRGAAASIEQVRSPPIVKVIVPASVEGVQTAAVPSSARSYSVGEPGSKFRFGFLEFEDDPDALAE